MGRMVRKEKSSKLKKWFILGVFSGPHLCTTLPTSMAPSPAHMKAEVRPTPTSLKGTYNQKAGKKCLGTLQTLETQFCKEWD